MPDREHKYLFWLDLETTGAGLEGNTIMEVGAAITDMNLCILYEFSSVVGIDEYQVEHLSPVVHEMHTKNGLLEESLRTDVPIGYADTILSSVIKHFNGSNHMAFAGSGVSHFDRKFIARDMPLLDKRLTHWPIDVGVLRRTFKYLLGVDEWPEDNKTHRALDDAKFHIEEMRFALDKMKKGVYNG